MSTTSTGRQYHWHAIVITVVTVFFVWWFVKDLDLAEVGRSMAAAHLGLLIGALAVTVQTYVIRAWRWQSLLIPIGRARYRIAFRTTVIGFAATFLLPGRVGEVLRPYLLARQEGFSVPAVFATVIVERVLDLASVMLLFGLFAATTSISIGRDVEVAATMAASTAVVLVVGMMVLAGHPERLGRWAGRLVGLLPGRLSRAAGEFVRTFTEGLAVMRRPGPLLMAFLLSLLLWISVALGIWIVSLAFDLTLPFMGSFMVLMFLVVGVAVPTPGGAGSFHWFYSYAMTTFFGAATDPAAAAAIVLHAVSFVPVGLAGLVFMAQDGLTLGGLKGMRSRAEAAEHPGRVGDAPETEGPS
jgi:glycosyltransferase 2 family protein